MWYWWRDFTPRLAAAMGEPTRCSPTSERRRATWPPRRGVQRPTILDTEIATERLRDAGEVTVDAEENVVYGEESPS
jgi:hypothetical protein